MKPISWADRSIDASDCSPSSAATCRFLPFGSFVCWRQTKRQTRGDEKEKMRRDVKRKRNWKNPRQQVAGQVKIIGCSKWTELEQNNCTNFFLLAYSLCDFARLEEPLEWRNQANDCASICFVQIQNQKAAKRQSKRLYVLLAKFADNN